MDFKATSLKRKGRTWIICTFPDGDVVAIRLIRKPGYIGWKATSQKGNYGNEVIALGWFTARMKEHLPDDVELKPSVDYDHEQNMRASDGTVAE